MIILLLLTAGTAFGYIMLQQKQIFSPKAASEFSLENFKAAFNACKEDPKYEPQYDPNKDGCINLSDYRLLMSRFRTQQTPAP